nr:hypothetical protein [uncultured Flavobacterium sp.]
MKKKLEADLISIAHRILKLKSKSDINQLYLETQKLYEKLAVLKFVDENFDTLKPTIGHSEVTSQIETLFEKQEEIPAEPIVEAAEIPETIKIEENFEPEIKEEIIAGIEEEEEIPEPVLKTAEEPVLQQVEEPVAEEEPKKEEVDESLSFTTKSEINPLPEFKPAFELAKEPEAKTTKELEKIQISFEDIIGVNYADTQFVKVDDFEPVPPALSINEFKEKKNSAETAVLSSSESKTATLNEKLAKGFHIDLNDRIAFTKNLFGSSSEDYSRVLNQLLTFDSFAEAKDFIENMVKPDYNNWEGKDDYAERFLDIVEKKFS